LKLQPAKLGTFLRHGVYSETTQLHDYDD